MNKKSIIDYYKEGHSIDWITDVKYRSLLYTKGEMTKPQAFDYVYGVIYGYLKIKQDEI